MIYLEAILDSKASKEVVRKKCQRKIFETLQSLVKISLKRRSFISCLMPYSTML